MTGTRTRSYWNRGCALLVLVYSGCTNDRFVVVGRLHREQVDASLTNVASPDAALDTISLTAESSTSLDVSTRDWDAAIATMETGVGNTSLDGTLIQDAGCAFSSPAHRYSFTGNGTTLPDLVGDATGELRAGATLSDTGSLTLDGDDDFVALPGGLLTGLTSVTVMLWVSYDGGPAYVRLFDFGTSSAGVDPPEGQAAVGRSYLAVTPATGYDPPGLTALAATEGSGSEVLASSDADIGDEAWHQVTAVLDGVAQQLRLYLDGELLSQSAVEHTASDITNDNNWLGRSQYDADPYTQITYDEVRIYNAALPDCAITSTFSSGPDVL